MTQASIVRRNMWAERIERCLSSSMSIERWCKLNHVGRSSLYAWLARFREEELGRFPRRNAATLNWIELTRGRSGGFQGHRARRHFLRRHRCFIYRSCRPTAPRRQRRARCLRRCRSTYLRCRQRRENHRPAGIRRVRHRVCAEEF